jgi:hypothetical protein
VRAFFYDSPFLQDENNVCVDDLRDAVRDDDRGALFLDGVQAIFNLLCGDRIKARRRFI